MTDNRKSELMTELTSDIVSAYVSNNPVSASQLPELIQSVYGCMTNISGDQKAAEPELKDPAVSIRKSLQHDHLVCLEDGKKFKSLKRHLKANHGLTPDEYRARWNLKPDYPMVAPAYATRRSQLAKQIGLGRKAKG